MAAPRHCAAGDAARRRTTPACNPAHPPCTPVHPPFNSVHPSCQPREPRLHASPCLQRLLVLDINIKMRDGADEYFEQLGASQRVRALTHGYSAW